jgi:hypothetical protein
MVDTMRHIGRFLSERLSHTQIVLTEKFMVVVAVNHDGVPFLQPRDGLMGIKSPVDNVTDAKDDIGIRFLFPDGVQRVDVGMKVGDQ